MSELEDLFAMQLDELSIPYEREVKFDKTRKWRADFLLPGKVIVELQGGTWMARSGHNTGRGLIRDYEKSNAAQLAGYKYLQYPAERVNDMTAIKEIDKLFWNLRKE